MTLLCNIRDCYFNNDRGFCSYDYLHIKNGVCTWLDNNPNYMNKPTETYKAEYDKSNIKQISTNKKVEKKKKK